MKKISALILASSIGLAVQAQTIDPLTGTGGPTGGYITTLVNDVSHGVSGASFTTGASGLSLNFVGTVSQPEQALSLASVSAFSTTFAVGDTLWVNVAIPGNGSQMDFGLAIASTATPTAAAAGNSWDSRKTFDWASISVRPNQNVVRGGDNIGTTLTTSFAGPALGSGGVANVTQLYITWVSTDVFTLGYVLGGIDNNVYTATFGGTGDSGSTIGAAIGFYGDIRATGTSLGPISNLTITVPEPATLALCGMGLAGLFVVVRRKK
jgi:hypothetical protein